MSKFIQRLGNDWLRNPAATVDQIKSVGLELKVKFPNEYVNFLLLSNGGEGRVNGKHLTLWGIEELSMLNDDYQIQHYVPGLVAIGSDGGGKAYALDFRKKKNDPSVIEMPYGDPGPESVKILASNFGNWYERPPKK